jgi:hypothetical protein
MTTQKGSRKVRSDSGKPRKRRAGYKTTAPENEPPMQEPPPPAWRKPEDDWRDAFIAYLRELPNIRRACEAVGIMRSMFYSRYSTDADFAAAVDEAKAEAIENLEATAYVRAQTTSDSLLMFLLKAHKPEVYRENFKLDVTALTDEQLEKVASGKA